MADAAGQGRGPGGELLRGEHVVEAEHRHRVRDVALHRPTGDLPGGGVGEYPVGMLRLPVGDPAHQPVVRVVVQRRGTALVVGGRRTYGVLDRLRVGGGIHDHCCR
jgi:hypothetical protein